jgi:hypothetical protein
MKMKGYKNNQQLLDDLKNYIDKNGVPTNLTKNFRAKNGLCSWETYEDHLGSKLLDWVKMCGIELSDDEIYRIKTRGIPNKLSKEECIKIIYSMQNELNRPLMYDDFRGSSEGHIGITQIRKYWGTVNNMKNELGLYINQESMVDKEIKTKKDFDEICKNFYEYLCINNIKSVTTKSIDENKDFPNYITLNKKSKEFYNIPITTYLNNKYEIIFGKRGHGKVFVFEDNETTVSHWEYEFSKFLRDIGFVYNKDYFRNINYSSFDNLYNGYMNCDYQIKVNNHIIYIELAGFLSDKTYIESYRNNSPLKSKSKEMYRQKLNQKREIFERNKLEYYILLPDEMNEKTYKNILCKYSKIA